MELFKHLPLLSIILCFVSVVLCSLLPARKGKVVTFLCEGICIVFGAAVLAYALQNGSTIYQMGHLTRGADGSALYWFNNVIRFGVLEGLLACLFPLIMLLSILGGMKKLEYDISPEKVKYFFVLANLALVALIALIYTDDIFTGYVFLEISTLSSIGLIAIKDEGRTTAAAIRYMIFNLVGSGLYLIGIVILYALTGYFMFEKIETALTAIAAGGSAMPAVTCSLALIVTGLGIKSGMFPFYFWMADTYGESTTASASIISGLISKGYILLLLKLMLRAFGFGHETLIGGAAVTLGVMEQTGIQHILFVLGFCGMILGSLSALFEKRINKMIAYSSAGQIGYIYLAMGLGSVGMKAAVFQILAHAVTKPLLFVSARGLIEVSDQKPQFIHLRGSALRNKFAGAGFLIGALSMIGFPALSGFIVKYLYLRMALADGIPMAMLIMTILALVISTLLITGYMIHTVITIYSPAAETYSGDSLSEKNRVGYVIAVSVLVILNVILGTSTSVQSLISQGLSMIGF